MFRAAFVSPCAVCPHSWQANASPRRLSALQCPQAKQVRDVLAAGTNTKAVPALSALYWIMCASWVQPASRMLLFSPDFAADPLGSHRKADASYGAPEQAANL
jgi:hypothetical protein